MISLKKEKPKNKIVVKKAIMKWARESIGLSIEAVSEKSKIDIEELRKWEDVDSEVKISDLKKLAKTEKRTLSFFFLNNPPTINPIPRDFRTLDSVNVETLSPKVRLAIRKAQRNRKFYAYLLEVTKSEFVKLKPISFNSNPTELAGEFRKYLNISIEEQKGWKSEGFAFNRWIDIIEGSGIPVFQLPFPKQEIRGFCLREDSLPPVIVLNAGDAIRGRIFTLFHEFYHLLLSQKDIDSLVFSKGEKLAHKLIEIKANEFAGSFLVPNEDFLGNEYVKKYLVTKDDRLVTNLVYLYKVSGEVIYRKFVNHGYMSEREYEMKRVELQKWYEREELRKRKKAEEKGQKFVPDYYRDIVKSSSYDLSQKAFAAAAKGVISTNELVTFLNVKLAGLEKVIDKTNQHYAQIKPPSHQQ